MNPRTTFFSLSLLLAVAPGLWAQDATPATGAVSAEVEPVSMEALDTPLEQNPATLTEEEEDRSAALKGLMEEAIRAAKQDKKDQLRSIAAGLRLPDSEKWFVMQFGEAKGRSLQRDYKHRVFEERLPRFFKLMVQDGSTSVKVSCVDHSKDKQGTSGQRGALNSMANPVKLYSVRFTKPGASQGFHVFSFAYVEGGFRCVGRLGVFGEE